MVKNKFVRGFSFSLLVFLFLLAMLGGISGCQSTPSKGTPAPTDTTKKEAAAVKTSFIKILDQYNTFSDTFQAYLGDMTTGANVDLAAYEADLADLHDQSTDLLTQARSLEIPSRYQEAKDSLVATVTLLDQSINDVLKYFDTKEKAQLSLAQEEFKQAKHSAYLAQEALDKQAKADGYKE
jgi:hypothetical protein